MSQTAATTTATVLDTMPVASHGARQTNESMLLSLEEQRKGLPRSLRTAVHNMYLRFFSVHGSIGAGKTTLLLRMAERGYPVLLENVAAWKDVCGYNLLDLYYGDRSKHALAFQMEVIRSRYHDIIQLANDEDWLRTPSVSDVMCRNTRGEPAVIRYVFTERDFFSCTDVFGKSLQQDGCLPAVHLCLLEKTVLSHRIPFPESIIYLDIPVDTCIERTHARARQEESQIENAKRLFEGIDTMYRDWMHREGDRVTFVETFGLDKIDTVIDTTMASLLHARRTSGISNIDF